MRRINFVWAWGLTFCLFLILPAYGQDALIEKRQKDMKENGASAKALKKAVEEKDYATAELKAKEIAGHAAQIPDLFPKGSTSEKSRAKSEIWEKWDEFTKDAAQMKKTSSELAEAAAAKDATKVKAKFDDLGNTCDSCHKSFRAAKKS